MAEFCLDCWNKMNHTHLKEEDVTMFEEEDWCEECAQVKPVICFLYPKKRPWWWRRNSVTTPDSPPARHARTKP